MKSASTYQLPPTPALELVSGKERGRHFEMGGDRLTLGRSDNNDIVIPSEAASRYHAVMERGEDGQIWIKDNQSKNGVQVNGAQVAEQALRHGDMVQVGGLVFRFHLPEGAGSELQPLAAVPDAPMDYSSNEMPEMGVAKAPRSKRPLIYGILALVLGGLYFMSQQPEKPAVPSGENGAPAVEAKEALVQPKLAPPVAGSKVPGLEDPLDRGNEEGLKADLANNPTREAEQYFRKGQREYLNKNYHRAIEAFRAALSLQRNHELADYYLRLALYEVETEAKRNMDVGKKYFQSMQYSRAMFHFSEAINLMQHRTTDKLVPEAEKYIDQCRRRLQAAEQLP